MGVAHQAEGAILAVLVGLDGSEVGPGSREVQQDPAGLGTKKDKIGLNEMNNVATKMIVIPDIAGSAQEVTEEDRALAISEMSERFDVTLRTLRFYEEKGLLNPVRRGARRFYGTRDVSRMRVILQAKKIGLTLAEIRRVIKLVESGTRREEQYRELQEICRAQQEILVEQKQMLDEQIEEVAGILSTFDKLVS
ncbi:MAG: hypothetical protein Tsb0019_17850 [Roseibium sp.]